MDLVARFLRIAAFAVIAGFTGGTGTAAASVTDLTEFSQPLTETAPLSPLGDANTQPAVFIVLASSDVDDDQPESHAQALMAPTWPHRAEMLLTRNDPVLRARSFLRPRPTGPPAA